VKIYISDQTSVRIYNSVEEFCAFSLSYDLASPPPLFLIASYNNFLHREKKYSRREPLHCPNNPLQTQIFQHLLDILIPFNPLELNISAIYKLKCFYSSLFMYFIQHCFICRHSDSPVAEAAWIERTQYCCD
jgi:hypothetical protein